MLRWMLPMNNWMDEPHDRIAWVLAEFVGGPLDGVHRAVPYGVLGFGLRSTTEPDRWFAQPHTEVQIGAYTPANGQHAIELTSASDDPTWDPTAQLIASGVPVTVFSWERSPTA